MNGNKKFRVTLLICVLLLSFKGMQAQDQLVKITRLEVDGKETKQDFKVILYVGKKTIKPVRKENSFIVPIEVINCEKASVRILFGGYNLFFAALYPPHFKSDWIIAVDKKPFVRAFVEPQEAKTLKLAYYLQFVPMNGDGTVLVVKVKKARNRKKP